MRWTNEKIKYFFTRNRLVIFSFQNIEAEKIVNNIGLHIESKIWA